MTLCISIVHKNSSMRLCASLIRKHISLLAPGEIFTTRDCLSYGSRSSVDQALAAMVIAGHLTRLVRGVFVLTSTKREKYSTTEIAMCKAKAFGKTLYVHPTSVITEGGPKVFEFDLTNNPNNQKTSSSTAFEPKQTSFCSSSTAGRFKRLNESKSLITDIVNLRSSCGKLTHFEDQPIGLLIRALCFIGEKRLSNEILSDALRKLTPTEQMELRMANAWMPHWLSDRLTTTISQVRSAKRFEAERRFVS